MQVVSLLLDSNFVGGSALESWGQGRRQRGAVGATAPSFGNFIKSIRTTDSFGCLIVSYRLSDKLLIENYYRFLVY